MTRATIYTRTDKGARAAASASREMANDLRKVLDAIDGSSPVDALQSKLNFRSAARLDRALAALVADEMIREAERPTGLPGVAGVEPNVQSEDSERKAKELRAKIKARREGGKRSPPEAAERAGQEAEENSQREAAERARPEAEAQARKLAEENSQREAAEHARQEAEAQARQLAEEDSQREAAERARQEAEAQARKLAEEEAARQAAERARQEAEEEAARQAAEEEAARQAAEEEPARQAAEEEAARQAAEEEAARQAAERARQEAEELAYREAEVAAEAKRKAEEAETGVDDEVAVRARVRAEAQQRLLAEEQAWLEAEEKLRIEEEAQASSLANAKSETQADKAGSGKRRKWDKTLALGVVALLVAGLVALHLISFDGQIPLFEKSLAAQFEQPVKITALRLSLLPRPQLRLEGVAIGGEGQIRVARIKAVGDLRNLFSDRKAFKSLELDSPLITAEGLGWILFGKPLARDMVSGEVSAVNASLESKHVSLPAFDVKLQPGGEGAWKTIILETADKNLRLELESKGTGMQIAVNAKSFRIPFGSALTLEDFIANGTADSAGLALTDFKGFVLGGTLSGSARLKWGAAWSIAGELNAKQIDTARLVPELLTGGRIAGAASYAMQAPEAAKLFTAPRLEGNFTVPWGTLLGVDLGRMAQGGERRGERRGETKFTELTGNFVYDRGATQLRQVRLSQTNLSAGGSLDVDADRSVRGRFTADLKLSSEQRHARIGISGTLGKLEWRLQ